MPAKFRCGKCGNAYMIKDPKPGARYLWGGEGKGEGESNVGRTFQSASFWQVSEPPPQLWNAIAMDHKTVRIVR